MKPSVIIELNEMQEGHMTRLLRSGLYGDTLDEVAKTLMLHGLRLELHEVCDEYIPEKI